MENGYYVRSLIKKINDGVENQARREVKKYHLSVAEARIIMYLKGCKQHKATQKEIENYVCVSHPTLISIMKQLEAQSIIRCETHPNDRRLKLVHLLDESSPTYHKLEQLMISNEQRLLDGFSEEEKSQFSHYLLRAFENIS